MIGGYPGNKATYETVITAFFDKACKIYVEPFMGAGGVFFSMSNKRFEKEIINDLDPALAFLYKALNEEIYREKVVESILNVDKDDDEVKAKEKFNISKKNVQQIKNTGNSKLSELGYSQEYVSSMVADIHRMYNQSFNGAGTGYSKQKDSYQFKSTTKINVESVIPRLAKRKLVVGNVEAIEFIRKYKNNPNVQFYIDWPYVLQYRSGKVYRTEMISLYEHYMYLNELKDAKAAVLLSDYRSSIEGVPTIHDAVLGANYRCIKIRECCNACQVVEEGEEKKEVTEFIWTNRIPETADMYCLLDDYRDDLTIDEYWRKIKVAGLKYKLPSLHMKEYNIAYMKLNDNQELFSKEEINSMRAKEKEIGKKMKK